MKRGIIYLAGPMSGRPEYNFDAFHSAAAFLEGRGWAVQSPAQSYNGSQRLPYRLYMISAVNLLLQCKAIALLPEWEHSRGARMEALLAQRFGLPFYNAHTGHRMIVDDLDVGAPRVLNHGLRPTSAQLLSHLVPIARRLAVGNREGITVAEVRKEAVRNGVLTGRETKADLSCLGHVMRRAGLVTLGTTRRSDIDVTHGNLQRVWYEDLSTACGEEEINA